MSHKSTFSRLGLASLAIATLLTLPIQTLAQTTGTDPNAAPVVDPNAGFKNSEGNGSAFGESGSPFDLIHRAVLINGTSLSDFSNQNQNRMTTEAANFRRQQQEALQHQDGAVTTAPAPSR
jgi:hypothetical protein